VATEVFKDRKQQRLLRKWATAFKPGANRNYMQPVAKRTTAKSLLYIQVRGNSLLIIQTVWGDLNRAYSRCLQHRRGSNSNAGLFFQQICRILHFCGNEENTGLRSGESMFVEIFLPLGSPTRRYPRQRW
jgi:hypothetical protein